MFRLPSTLAVLLLSLLFHGQALQGEDRVLLEGEDREYASKVPNEEVEVTAKVEESPPTKEVMQGFFRASCWFYAWIPWGILFMCAFDGSIVPLKPFDAVFGSAGKVVPGLDGWQVFLVIPGLIVFYMSVVLWLSQFPEKVGWESFPSFCVAPRSFFGLLNIHQAPWLHISQSHYGYSTFITWVTAPILLSCGRRTFIFSTFFSSFVGYFAYWCVGGKASCVAGLSPVYSGWLGTLTVSCISTCPPNWGRFLCTLCVLAFYSYRLKTLMENFRWDGGEHYDAHITGFASGFFFGLLHFSVQKCGNRCPKMAFGQFEGYEKLARKQGEPWPGSVAYFCRLVSLTCCGCLWETIDNFFNKIKAKADDKAVEMQKW